MNKLFFALLIFFLLIYGGSHFFSSTQESPSPTFHIEGNLIDIPTLEKSIQIYKEKKGNLKDLEGLAQFLSQNNLAEKVSVYYDAKEKLKIDFICRKAKIQVFLSDQTYFIDEKGNFFQSSIFPSTTQFLARGFFPPFQKANKEEEIFQKLIELTHWIEKSPFWKAQIDQIFLSEKKEFYLQTKVGMHKILLGKWENTFKLKQKMEVLEALYFKNLHPKEWNAFQSIDLRFEKQVVLKKK